jgi:hypothetical protein
LPESAHECAASASSDADPVTTAAAVFATAMSTLAPKATSTVIRLSEPPGPPPAPGTDLSSMSWDRRAVPPAKAGAWARSPPCSFATTQW